MIKPRYTLAELAAFLSAELRGEPETVIRHMAPLQSAQAGEVAFLDNPKYKKFLATTSASAVIVSQDMAKDIAISAALLIVDNPYFAFAKTAALFEQKPELTKGCHPSAIVGPDCVIHPTAIIGPQVVLGARVKIGAHAVIQAGCFLGDDVVLGDEVYLWPRVTLYHATEIGAKTIIHSGAVLGADGFGFAFHEGSWHKIPQIGRVLVGDQVEIGANTTIDRGALGDTIIGQGVKLDNQIQIGHNVQVGDHTVISAGAAIAGSTKIGKYCRIGGLVGISGHITIADKVVIAAMSAVPQSITDAGVYASAVTTQPFSAWKRNIVRFSQLDDMAKRLATLEKQMSQQGDNIE